jgi:hypothetical protein
MLQLFGLAWKPTTAPCWLPPFRQGHDHHDPQAGRAQRGAVSCLSSCLQILLLSTRPDAQVYNHPAPSLLRRHLNASALAESHPALTFLRFEAWPCSILYSMHSVLLSCRINFTPRLPSYWSITTEALLQYLEAPIAQAELRSIYPMVNTHMTFTASIHYLAQRLLQ